MTETATPAANPMQQLIDVNRGVYSQTVEEANKVATQYKAQGNVEETVADLINTSDDEKLVAYRKFRDETNERLLAAQTQVEQYTRENLLPKSEDALTPEQLKTNYTELRDQVKAISTVLKTFGGEDALKDLPDLLSIGRSGNAGSQSGVRRPRVSRILLANAKDADNKAEVFSNVKQKDGTVEKVVRMGILAQKLNVEPSDLIEAADAAAGTKEWSTLNGKPFSFAYATGDAENGENWIIEVTPEHKDS